MYLKIHGIVPTVLNFPTSTKKTTTHPPLKKKRGLCQMCPSEPIHTCWKEQFALCPSKGYRIDMKVFSFGMTCSYMHVPFKSYRVSLQFVGIKCSRTTASSGAAAFSPIVWMKRPDLGRVHSPVQPFLGGTGVRRFGVELLKNTPINLVESRDKRQIRLDSVHTNQNIWRWIFTNIVHIGEFYKRSMKHH